MLRSFSMLTWTALLLLVAGATDVFAQRPPYDVFPAAEPPYYRVRYEAGVKPGELVYPVNFYHLDSQGGGDAARRHRASTWVRRRFVQVGTDGGLRPALASAGAET